MLKEEVDEEDVAQVVAKWTGIPVSKMLEGEMQKLLTMEERLAPTRDRTGRGPGSCGQRSPTRARGLAGSKSPDRFFYLSWSNRRR